MVVKLSLWWWWMTFLYILKSFILLQRSCFKNKNQGSVSCQTLAEKSERLLDIKIDPIIITDNIFFLWLKFLLFTFKIQTFESATSLNWLESGGAAWPDFFFYACFCDCRVWRHIQSFEACWNQMRRSTVLTNQNMRILFYYSLFL